VLALVSDEAETTRVRESVLRWRWRKVVYKAITVKRRRELARLYLESTDRRSVPEKGSGHKALGVCWDLISTVAKFVWNHKQLRGAVLSAIGSYAIFGAFSPKEYLLTHVNSGN